MSFRPGRATTVKGVIRGAKRLIQQKGWVQNSDVTDDRSAFCARGALAVAAGVPLKEYTAIDGHKYYELDFTAAGKNKAFQDAMSVTNEAADEMFGNEVGCYCDIVDFNDYPGRTMEEVLAIFDKALAKA